MAYDPLGFEKMFKWGKDAVSDPFSGENVGVHKPDKDNFQYTGLGEGHFQTQAAAAKRAQLPWQVNAARQNALASREGITAQQAQLQKMMNDPNSSAAQAQLQQAQSGNMSQALALARSSAGGAGAQAAALRQAQFQNSAAGTQTAQASAVLRAQEQAGWQQQMGQLALQQRAADLQAQGLEGQIGLGLMGEQNKAALGFSALGQNASAMEQKGLIGYENVKSGNNMSAQIANAQLDAQRDASIMGMAGAVGGGLMMGGAFGGSDVRGKTDIAPVSGTSAEGMSAPVNPGQQPPTGEPFDYNKFGAHMMQYGASQQGGGGMAPINPYSFLQQPQMVDSDKRAKTAEAEVGHLRSLLARIAPAPAPAMQTGAIQRAPDSLDRQRAGVTDEAGAAQYGKAWIKANAQADSLERLRAMQEAERAAQAQASLGHAEQSRAYNAAQAGDELAQYRANMVDSDERAKDVFAAIRQRAQEGEPSAETASFISRARERMAEDQEKKLDHALLSAGLDRIAREATVDGGAPPLQAGRTSVARFDDVPVTVQAAAQTPNYQWRYKDKFAAEANARAGLPPTAPQGYARRTSPMAQDMEKSPLYAPAVVTGPDGMKRVDSGTVSMANAGVLSDLSRFAQEQEERIKRLESGRSRVPYPQPRGTGL